MMEVRNTIINYIDAYQGTNPEAQGSLIGGILHAFRAGPLTYGRFQRIINNVWRRQGKRYGTKWNARLVASLTGRDNAWMKRYQQEYGPMATVKPDGSLELTPNWIRILQV